MTEPGGKHSAGAEHGGSKTALERLSAAIRYPDGMPNGALSYVFRVDGAEIRASESSGRLTLAMTLTSDEGMLPALASYAAGRMLREEATLAYEPDDGNAFLWQDAPAAADSHTLVRLFETFMDSCDWWRERVTAASGALAGGGPEITQSIIRP